MRSDFILFYGLRHFCRPNGLTAIGTWHIIQDDDDDDQMLAVTKASQGSRDNTKSG